jgi:ribosome maturation protein Sdo1
MRNVLGHQRKMKTHIQELIACYKTLDEITAIIESGNSRITAEQRLSEIETTIKNLFQNL